MNKQDEREYIIEDGVKIYPFKVSDSTRREMEEFFSETAFPRILKKRMEEERKRQEEEAQHEKR